MHGLVPQMQLGSGHKIEAARIKVPRGRRIKVAGIVNSRYRLAYAPLSY